MILLSSWPNIIFKDTHKSTLKKKPLHQTILFKSVVTDYINIHINVYYTSV
jgi:hypothetical protein